MSRKRSSAGAESRCDGGRLIVVVHRPFIYKLMHPEADDFDVTERPQEWTRGGRSAPILRP